MANFPSLEPTTRVFGLGNTPQLFHDSDSGVGVRFVQGADRVQQLLNLGNGQQGSLIAFDLPSVIWSGYTTPPVSASDYRWRYSGAFDVSIAAPLRYNISIELVTIPI